MHYTIAFAAIAFLLAFIDAVYSEGSVEYDIPDGIYVVRDPQSIRIQ